MTTEECKHHFSYEGIVYKDEDMSMSGTGAKRRYYEDKYFCVKCLATRFENRRYIGNSYHEVEFGATAK